MRILRRALFCPLAVLVAVLCQLTLVNRAPLPGGGGVPDLVLLVVAALGVTVGPTTGMLAGFAGGLAIDVAPPGGHLAGEYALVYCLVGYACGRVRDVAQGSSAQRSTVASLIVMAAGVAAGEAGKAALGMMLSDPNMTGPAIRHVLPAALVYDLLLCPFVLWLTLLAVGRPQPERAPQPQFAAPGLPVAFRLASAGAAPKLRLAGSGAPLIPQPLRSEPKLRLSSGRSSSFSRTNSAFSTARTAAAGGRPVRVNFSGNGRGNQIGGASPLRTPAGRSANSPPKGWLRANGHVAPPAWQGKSPPRGWLRANGHVASPARRPGSPPRGWLRANGQVPAPAWRARTPGKGWLRANGHVTAPAWQGRSPGKGWLRPARPPAPVRRATPGRGWLSRKPPKLTGGKMRRGGR
jgi:rod shape-determining protein MreD